MKKETAALINKIYAICISIFTAVIGILFIVQTIDIYIDGKATGNMYTPETIESHFRAIAIPFTLWIIFIILGIILKIIIPSQNKCSLKMESKEIAKKLSEKLISLDEIKNEEEKQIILKEKKKRLIVWIAVLLICLISIVLSCIYLFDPDHYTLDGKLMLQAGTIALSILPYVLLCFGALLIGKAHEEFSSKIELVAIRKLLTNKDNLISNKLPSLKSISSKRFLLITRAVILTISIVFIVVGVINGGARDVLIKALNICTECIGLG